MINDNGVSLQYKGICWPLIIYIIVTFIALIIISAINVLDATSKAIIIILTIIWSAFWGFMLWVLCYYCHSIWAWVIMFIPFLINLFFLMAILTILGVFESYTYFPDNVDIVE